MGSPPKFNRSSHNSNQTRFNENWSETFCIIILFRDRQTSKTDRDEYITSLVEVIVIKEMNLNYDIIKIMTMVQSTKMTNLQETYEYIHRHCQLEIFFQQYLIYKIQMQKKCTLYHIACHSARKRYRKIRK